MAASAACQAMAARLLPAELNAVVRPREVGAAVQPRIQLREHSAPLLRPQSARDRLRAPHRPAPHQAPRQPASRRPRNRHHRATTTILAAQTASRRHVASRAAVHGLPLKPDRVAPATGPVGCAGLGPKVQCREGAPALLLADSIAEQDGSSRPVGSHTYNNADCCRQTDMKTTLPCSCVVP